MDLPSADRKALVMGMTLHEKGRKLMEDNQWKGGLELLLQADNSFNHWSVASLSLSVVSQSPYMPCSAPQFLEAVDNHAFLHLDICWCYFKLKVSPD